MKIELKKTGCSPKDQQGKNSNRPHKITNETSFEVICIDYGRNLSVPNITTNDNCQ